jgi:hypothetical protein
MEDVQQSLRKAREQLAAFEEASARDNLMGRLKAASPGHPVLLGRNVVAAGSLVLLLGAAAMLAAPAVSRDIAVTVNGVSEGLGFPLPIAMLMLALCGGGMVAGLHQLALAAARNAPLLPHEAKQHQRLVADVKQLESRLAIEGTPRPAVRITSR